ncbi:MAG: hypothetical protein ABW215_06420 [Kibdelosporangium sp.]
MGRMRLRTLVLVLSAGLALTGCSSGEGGVPLGQDRPTGTTTSSRPPFNGKTLQIGEVVKVKQLSGARMQSIEDGEVRGFGTVLTVLEFGTADRVDDGDVSTGGFQAAGGGVLIAFRVSVTVDKDENKADDQVVANVSVDGTQRALPQLLGEFGSSSATTTGNYIVAVPEQRRTVDLELKSTGLVQQFDLLEGKPKGDRPAALYRPATGTYLKQEAFPPTTFEVAPRKGEFSAVHTVTVTNANLGYFLAATGTPASAQDKAYLVLSGTGRTQSGESCVAPLAVHKLTDDKGTAYQPVASSKMDEQPPLVGDSTFTLVFEVPAEMRKATLTVTPTQMVCQVSTATFQTVPARGEGRVEIAIPEK